MKQWCYKKDGTPRDHCADHTHCRACRTDQGWRDNTREHFEVPDDWDDVCPFGVTLKELNKLPSPWHMFKNLLGTIKRVVVHYYQYRKMLAPRTERKRRMTVCRSCDFFDPKYSRCRKCGCCMKAKVLLQAAKCKLNLW